MSSRDPRERITRAMNSDRAGLTLLDDFHEGKRRVPDSERVKERETQNESFVTQSSSS